MNEINLLDWRVRGEPDPVDIHVGSRIRTRRILLGKSQEVIAHHLGVSFQQLQKYESGTNRVSASRLYDLAHILMTPISFFFDEMPAELNPPGGGKQGDGGEAAAVQLNSRVTLDLIRDFYRIKSSAQQRCLLDLVRSMAGQGEDVGDNTQHSGPTKLRHRR